MWRPVMVVNYVNNDGTSTTKNTGVVDALNYKIQSVSRTGYTLKAWNTKKDGTGKSYTPGSTVQGIYQENQSQRSITRNLYAQWTPNKYTVSFNANGGSGSTAAATATYASAMPSISNKITRSGYTFSGFYDAASGGTQYYTASGASARV